MEMTSSIYMRECSIPNQILVLGEWKPLEPKVKGGWLERYARLVSSADEGAVLK